MHLMLEKEGILEIVDGRETAAQFVISCTESAYRDNGYVGLGTFIGSFLCLK